MRKLLYILIFTLIGQTSVYDFPIVESNTFTQIESLDKEDRKLTKKQNHLGLIVGLFFFGCIIGVCYC